jgi:hypothetical protein
VLLELLSSPCKTDVTRTLCNLNHRELVLEENTADGFFKVLFNHSHKTQVRAVRPRHQVSPQLGNKTKEAVSAICAGSAETETKRVCKQNKRLTTAILWSFFTPQPCKKCRPTSYMARTSSPRTGLCVDPSARTLKVTYSCLCQHNEPMRSQGSHFSGSPRRAVR